jgi:glutamine amidotransferase
MTIAIIDYGVGNLGSIKNMLAKIGVQSLVTSQPDEIASARQLILPGVGAFDTGMSRLNSSGLVPLLNDLVLGQRRPILGICLGMQLMTASSEEGKLPGLGWVSAQTRKIAVPSDSGLKIPHMGWNEVQPRKASRLLGDADAGVEQRFYFVHTYCVHAANDADVLLTTQYGGQVVAAFEADNIVGVQFHPEKSHKFGMALLRNFVEKY